MKKTIGFVYLATTLSLTSCKVENEKDKNVNTVPEKTDSITKGSVIDKVDILLAETVKAHGGEAYDTAHYSFIFRKKHVSFHTEGRHYTYTSTELKDNRKIKDVLENGKLTRTVDGAETELVPKDVVKYTEALNSIVYFATLPYKLQDAAVKKSYEGSETIENQTYEILAVTFDEEGGGTDYDDKFMYWIRSDTKTIDYLAYSYATNDGGVRFRTAYNPRTIGGIRFQDYINYGAPLGTPLKELPELLSDGKLKELSRIETEHVKVLEK